MRRRATLNKLPNSSTGEPPSPALIRRRHKWYDGIDMINALAKRCGFPKTIRPYQRLLDQGHIIEALTDFQDRGTAFVDSLSNEKRPLAQLGLNLASAGVKLELDSGLMVMAGKGDLEDVVAQANGLSATDVAEKVQDIIAYFEKLW